MQFKIFYNLLTVLPTVSNMYAQVARVQSSANHVRHISAYHVQHVEGTAQLLSLTELKLHLF